MPNAGEGFQAQRPQPIYSQVNQVAPRITQGFIAGQLPGILNAVGGIKDLIHGSSADKVNEANAASARGNQWTSFMKQLHDAPEEKRKELMDAFVTLNPDQKEAVGKIDPHNLFVDDIHTREATKQAGRMYGEEEKIYRANYPDQFPGEPNTGNSRTGVATGASLGDAVAPDSPGSQPQANGSILQWGADEVAPQPTVVKDAQQGIRPDPNGPQTSSDQYQDTTQYEDANGPPPVTEVQLPGPVAEDQDVAKIKVAQSQMQAMGKNFKDSDFSVSPHTGEVNLNPALVVDHPEMPPAAYIDIPTKGPETVAIQQVVTKHLPDVLDAQNRLMQSGAAFRLANSYRLELQPDPKDMLMAEHSKAEMAKVQEEFKAQAGIMDWTLDDMYKAKSVALWMSAATDPTIRASPEVLRDMAVYKSWPPTKQTAALAMAKEMATLNQTKAEFDADQKYRADQLATTRLGYDVQDRNSRRDLQASKAATKQRGDSATAALDWKKAQYNSDEAVQERKAKYDELVARTGKNIAEGNKANLEYEYQRNGGNPELLKLLTADANSRLPNAVAAAGPLNTALNNTTRDVSALRSSIKSLITSLSTPQQQIVEKILAGTAAPSDVAAVKDIATKGAAANTNLGTFLTQYDEYTRTPKADDPEDKGGILYQQRKQADLVNNEVADALAASKDPEKLLATALRSYPQEGVKLMEAQILRGLPPGSPYVFYTLNAKDPNSLVWPADMTVPDLKTGKQKKFERAGQPMTVNDLDHILSKQDFMFASLNEGERKVALKGWVDLAARKKRVLDKGTK